jgi:thioredoxin 1
MLLKNKALLKLATVALISGSLMATLEVTQSNFDQEVLKSNIPVVVDFYANWCGKCREISPTIDSLANEYAGKVKFVKVNIDKSRPLINKYQIKYLPTLVFFKNGNQVKKEVGYRTKDAIIQAVNSIR